MSTQDRSIKPYYLFSITCYIAKDMGPVSPITKDRFRNLLVALTLDKREAIATVDAECGEKCGVFCLNCWYVVEHNHQSVCSRDAAFCKWQVRVWGWQIWCLTARAQEGATTKWANCSSSGGFFCCSDQCLLAVDHGLRGSLCTWVYGPPWVYLHVLAPVGGTPG